MPPSATARTPPPRSSIAVPVRRRAATWSAKRAAPGTGRPAAASARRWRTRRRRAGESSAKRSSEIVPRPAPLAPRAVQLGVDEGVEHLRLVAQQGRRAQDVRGGGGVDLRQLRQQAVADPVARVGRLGVGRVVAPGETPLLAVGGRLGASEGEQRPRQPPVAGPHAQQRAAARRGGEPVENRLDLIVGGVAGHDRRLVRQRQSGGRGVAGVARPRLQVAGALRAPRALDLELHPQLLAELGAVALVLAGVVAQAVVDVERGDLVGAERPHRQVEQADRVAPAGEQRDDRRPRRQQPPIPHLLEHEVRIHALSVGAPPQSVVARTRKSGVGSGKPFKLTSPIGSNSSPSLSSIVAITRSVTSTSPAWARLTTR